MLLFTQKMILRKTGAALLLITIIGWCLLLQPSSNLWTTTPKNSRLQLEKNIAQQKNAYVFYATSNPYACSALVNAHRLRNFLKSKIPIIFLLGPGVNVSAIDAITASNIGITVVRDNAPALPTGSIEYYEEVLLKLRAFRLHHVYPALERVLVMDSDQLVRKNLDHLFRLPAADVAAPLMYWGAGTGVTTALMVVSLRQELWGIVNNAMKHMRNGEYDMDLINKVLGKRLMVLPGRYCTLNSHWEAGDTPGWFKGIKTNANATSEELVELYDQVEVLHFTAMGKPWKVAPDRIVSDREILRKNKVHPLFVEQFGEWHGNATEVCTAFWEFEEPPPVEAPVEEEEMEEEMKQEEMKQEEELKQEKLKQEEELKQEELKQQEEKLKQTSSEISMPKATTSVAKVHSSAPVHSPTPIYSPAQEHTPAPVHAPAAAV